MQLKIAVHYVVLICSTASIMGRAVFPGGCYECEEEVWEEVPCDEIPSNSTTILPPLPCFYTTPSYTTTTATTSTTVVETTVPTTTTPTTTTPTTTPTTTTPTTTTPATTTSTSTTTTTTTTTTTPSPVKTTTPKHNDPYNNCFCECKVGCKEYCRKVIVNPEPIKQIVQVSKITEPVAQGRVETMHFHQRELIQSPKNYATNYSSNNIDSIPQNPIYNNYKSTTPAPPANNYEEEIVMEPLDYAAVKNKNSLNNYQLIPAVKYDKNPLPAPAQSVYRNPYTQAAAGYKNHNPYSYTEAKAGYKNHNPFSYTQVEASSKNHNPYSSQIQYYTAPNNDFPIPFEKVYTKVSKSLLGPSDGVQLSITPAIGKSNPSYSKSNRQSSSYSHAPYSPLTPVQNYQLENQLSLSNSHSYDDTFDAIIHEFMNNNPPKEAPYEPYSRPYVSVSYNR